MRRMPPSSRMACGTAVSAASRPSSDAPSAWTAKTSLSSVSCPRRSASRFSFPSPRCGCRGSRSRTRSRRRKSIRARRISRSSRGCSRAGRSRRPRPSSTRSTRATGSNTAATWTRRASGSRPSRSRRASSARRASRWPSCWRRWPSCCSSSAPTWPVCSSPAAAPGDGGPQASALSRPPVRQPRREPRSSLVGGY